MGTPAICQTIAAATTAELRRERDVATRADMVELRLDGVRDIDVRAALSGRLKPAIVTCRPAWEGGRFDGAEEERHRVLTEAIDAGAEFVDVEWRAPFRDEFLRRTRGRRTVLSLHDFDGVPADLPGLYAAMRQAGADVVKIAVTARRLCDVFAFDVLHADVGLHSTVCIAMGASGIPTRILPGRFHSAWTYAGDSAPGQIPVSVLLDQFRARDLLPTTAVYGVVGSRVSRSLSPLLHNAAFRAGGVDAVYLPFQTDDFADFLAFAERLPVAGASVTMPFKEAAMQQAAETDAISRLIGAANTMGRGRAGWRVTNTDAAGFLEPIRDYPLRGRRVAILGAGGAARAVAGAVSSCGGNVAVFGRSFGRAAAIAHSVNGEAFEGLPPAGSWDVLVNATPVGSAPEVDRTPFDRATDATDIASAVAGGELVYDLVYDPQETKLLRAARTAGCRTVSGLEMLVAQAMWQSEWWTGQAPNEPAMRDALAGSSRDGRFSFGRM